MLCVCMTFMYMAVAGQRKNADHSEIDDHITLGLKSSNKVLQCFGCYSVKPYWSTVVIRYKQSHTLQTNVVCFQNKCSQIIKPEQQ